MAEPAKPELLIVDDDPAITDTLSYVLGADFDVRTAESRPHAKALLRTLAENIARFEKRFGAIPERPLPPRPSEDAPDTTN